MAKTYIDTGDDNTGGDNTGGYGDNTGDNTGGYGGYGGYGGAKLSPVRACAVVF